MKYRFLRIKMILLTVLVVLDASFYFTLRYFLTVHKFNPGKGLAGVILLIAVLFSVMLLRIEFNSDHRRPALIKNIFRKASLFVIVYLPKLIFILFVITNGIANLLLYGINAITGLFRADHSGYLKTFFFSYIGLFLSIALFLLMIYGVVAGRHYYKIDKKVLHFRNLPAGFNGLRIVQISDIHLGSMSEIKSGLKRAIQMINSLKPELILFTGDLVNNFSEESLPWIPEVSKLEAPLGKYSILGNHDYGDYWDWKSPEEKQANFDLLLSVHKQMGFTLLLNEARTLLRNDEKIGLLGVENWGRPPFHQYGNLDLTNSRLEPVPFKILMSHDPTHWEEEVQYRRDIDLTLSGHTHAMQFGLRIGKLKWSPVQYIYKKWAGLYENQGRYLYVNRGLGYIGYLGRIGMRPEITLFTLKKQNTGNL